MTANLWCFIVDLSFGKQTSTAEPNRMNKLGN